MFKGETSVRYGVGMLGEEVTIKHTTGWTEDYENDSPKRIEEDIVTTIRFRKLDDKTRQFLTTLYETNKIQKITILKGITVSQDDYFSHNNRTYTILQVDDTRSSYQVAICKYEERL